jgi:hypothetical protein
MVPPHIPGVCILIRPDADPIDFFARILPRPLLLYFAAFTIVLQPLCRKTRRSLRDGARNAVEVFLQTPKLELGPFSNLTSWIRISRNSVPGIRLRKQGGNVLDIGLGRCLDGHNAAVNNSSASKIIWWIYRENVDTRIVCTRVYPLKTRLQKSCMCNEDARTGSKTCLRYLLSNIQQATSFSLHLVVCIRLNVRVLV